MVIDINIWKTIKDNSQLEIIWEPKADSAMEALQKQVLKEIGSSMVSYVRNAFYTRILDHEADSCFTNINNEEPYSVALLVFKFEQNCMT